MLTSLEEARALVLARVAPLEVVHAEVCPGSLGLVVAEDVTASDDVPPLANSAVDGFAVHAADVAEVPAELHVIGTLAAGAPPHPSPLGRGEALRIMTGAPVPQGCDAVVMVEDSTDLGADRVRLSRRVAAGANVRPRGDDLRAGEVAVAASTALRAAHLGLLATVGRTSVQVHRRPRVGVMSTGDELVAPGEPMRPGQIRDSNRPMLLALCAAAGVEGVDLGTVADDEGAVEAALVDAATRCDVVLTSGGVSMGDFDPVKAVLSRSSDARWMQIAMRPAKPFAVATIGEVVVLGLPGNPVSSLVSFEVLARPALRALAGFGEPVPPTTTAVAGTDITRRPDGKLHLVRVRLDWSSEGPPVATPATAQGSHQLAASADADALGFVPDGHGIAAGDAVEVHILS